jgi:large subunit ribosomal protein L9
VKVTFLEDVPNVARVGQTRTVADGFARNYLLPRRLAVVADSRAAATMEGQLKKKVKQRELEEAEMAKLAEKIEGAAVTIKAKVGENEKLYGSVTAADIAEAVSAVAGREIDKKKVELAEPIRQAGVREVNIRLAHEISATITVKVISEEAPEEAETGETEKPAKKTKARAKKAAPEEAGQEAAPEAAAPEAEVEAGESETTLEEAGEYLPDE